VTNNKAAARRLLLDDDQVPEPFDPVPWFWSDQYDAKVQLAGWTGPQVDVVEGDLEADRFVVLYGEADRCVGVLGLRRPGRVVRLRQMVVDGLGWDEARDQARAGQ